MGTGHERTVKYGRKEQRRRENRALLGSQLRLDSTKKKEGQDVGGQSDIAGSGRQERRTGNWWAARHGQTGQRWNGRTLVGSQLRSERKEEDRAGHWWAVLNGWTGEIRMEGRALVGSHAQLDRVERKRGWVLVVFQIRTVSKEKGGQDTGGSSDTAEQAEGRAGYWWAVR